jgi:hypothetical protein
VWLAIAQHPSGKSNARSKSDLARGIDESKQPVRLISIPDIASLRIARIGFDQIGIAEIPTISSKMDCWYIRWYY